MSCGRIQHPDELICRPEEIISCLVSIPGNNSLHTSLMGGRRGIAQGGGR